MKLPGWEKATSAEQYRQMIEAEYYRLKAEKESCSGQGAGLEEVKLRLFLSLLDKPERSAANSDVQSKRGELCQFPMSTQRPEALLQDDQASPDQVA